MVSRTGSLGRPAFVGRVSLVAEVVRACEEGEARCITGPPGIGKSALARHVVEQLEATVLWGRCAPQPSTPLRALAEIAIGALGAGADLGAVDETVFGASVRTLLGADAIDSAHHSMMVSEGFRRLLATLEGPVVLVVEDLHWADDETLEVLDHLVDRAAPDRSLLLTTRAHESSRVDAVCRSWAQRGVVESVDLAPLTEHEIIELIRLYRPEAGNALIDAIGEASEGSPLLIEEYTRSTEVTGDNVVVLTIPVNLRDAVNRRVDNLAEPQRTHVQLASICGREFDLDVLARCGVSRVDAEEAEQAAVSAQLAEPSSPGEAVRFRHALTRDSIVEAMRARDRTRIAARALASFESGELDDTDLEVASRLAAAAGDERRASELLIEAASRALRRGVSTTALLRLDSAAELTDSDALYGPVIRELRLEALALAGRTSEALELGSQLTLELRSRNDVARLYRVELAMARAAGSQGDWVAAADRLDQAFPSYDSAPPEARTLRAIAAMEVGEVTLARVMAAAALGDPRTSGASLCEAHEVLGRVAREVDYGAAAQHFRAAVGVAADHGLQLWRARSLLELGLCEATQYGRPSVFADAGDASRQCGALALSAMSDYNLANLRSFRIEPSETLDVAERAIQTARHLGAGKLEAMAHVVAGQGHAIFGSRARSRQSADRALNACSNDAEVQGLVAGMLGWSALMAGDLDVAVDEYARSLDLLIDLPVPTATAPWYLGPLVLASAAHELAVPCRAQLDSLSFTAVPTLYTLSPLIDAVFAGTAGQLDIAQDHHAEFERRQGENRELADNLVGLWHLLETVAGAPALAQGWGSPIPRLRAANDWFSDRGLEHSARWSAAVLREAGVAPRTRGRAKTADIPPDLRQYGLTRREVDVLVLLGERLTNREIADRLVISRSTVKTHVERLLAKTHRKNRHELADLASLLRS